MSSSNKTDTLFNVATYAVMALNLAAGVLAVNAIVTIIVFVGLHAIVRWQYLNYQAKQDTKASDNPIANPPNAVRGVAVVVTSVITANVLYWIGYGAHLGLGKLIG